MKTLFSLVFLLVVISVHLSYQQRPRPFKPYRPSRPCCSALRHYKRLYRQIRNQCKKEVQNLTTGVNKLKTALNTTQVVLKVVPQSIKPPTLDRLELIRVQLIEKLQNLSFNNSDENDGLNNEGRGQRGRRTLPAYCPTDFNTIKATIGNPGGISFAAMNTASLSHRDSLDPINVNLLYACAECRYQITLPGYIPEEHEHIICPQMKQSCIAGVGECAKLEVLTTIYDPVAQESKHIILNKGCSCQQLSSFYYLGDGN
ncbi:uncharacterized protein [Clytia hemisphaerica]|uniref:Uncharacterized protein n=1 Tax=Clytia hemisphaerica TaxID=252671 RepID=A0A7M5VBJ7_9CNID|eukprot:TCONS_00028431-protein